jgi:hypothetical protein
MTMRDLSHDIAFGSSVTLQTITSSNLTGVGVDLKGFNSATIVLVMGNIDEMGGSPQGGARIDLQLQESDDNSNWGNVTGADVVDLSGVSGVTGGIVASVSDDRTPVGVGYVGEKRYLRAILQPSGLSNGGPAGAIVIKGHPRHAPAS